MVGFRGEGKSFGLGGTPTLQVLPVGVAAIPDGIGYKTNQYQDGG